MMERLIVQGVTEYVVNCAWQIPLLAAGAWLLVKIVRPGILAQHGLWLSVLAMAVLLPMRGVEENQVEHTSTHNAATVSAVQIRAEEASPIEPATLRGGAHQREPTALSGERVPLPLHRHSLVLSRRAMRWLAAIYMASVLVGAVRLARGLLATRWLVRRSRAVMLTPRTMQMLDGSCQRLGVKMPWLRESSEADGPAIVRAMRPVLLLPERFEEHTEEQMGAALLHELAHVRRRDYLVNLICQFAALPVIWHPSLYLIQQRIRRTREMACDAIAAEEMESGAEYARCLVSLARQMMRSARNGQRTQAMGLFENNTMEERVMRLTETRIVPTARARTLRLMCGGAAMMAVIAAALTFHVRPTFAAADMAGQQAASSTSTAASTVAVAPTAPIQLKPSAQVPGPDKGTLAIARGSHANVTADKGDYVHRWKAADGEAFALVNRDPKEPTVEEQRQAERQLADSQKEIDEANQWADDFGFEDPKWKLQMEEMKRQLEQADWLANDPAMKQRMEQLQKKLSRLDATPELKKFNDAEWQKQFAELQKKNLSELKLDFDFQNRVEIATAIDQAKLNETIANAMKGQDERMAKLQEEMKSGELKQKLEEATRLLQDVKKQMETLKMK